ncbi:MAG: deoxyribose-phosphate aldolase [Atribacterota bacterium]|nr:deoxyribose-phosphate aldolase [Atribacterota bacterium]MDD4895760.1 deoxyribose-phosphate aldolase [Atribacterota bacterium]MDD5637538.1 deoxyribose-phosphate aldolase [Atribacterota bacterium]
MPEIISMESAKILAKNNIARLIDHTALRPDVTGMQIEKLCKEALQYHFYSVCINASFIPLARAFLSTSEVKICTVVGFPLGATLSRVKAYEAEEAAKEGAEEIDMVINVSTLKDKDYQKVQEDIKLVVKAVSGLICKVILENCLLTDQEKEVACQIAAEAGASFVKTSTGFEQGGATVEDIKLMRNVVGNHMGIKAAGGIRDYKAALQMVEAGATRIGASKGVEIVEGSHL